MIVVGARRGRRQRRSLLSENNLACKNGAAMPSEAPLPPDLNEPLDAVIEAELVRAVPQKPTAKKPTSPFAFENPAPAQYVVPRRFGMAAILGIITALAVLFGGFHVYDAHPVLYLFFGVQSIVICLAQMFYGKTPRAASAITGGILMPVFLILTAAVLSPRRIDEAELFCTVIGCVPVGAFFGYLTGTMAAGVFLLMDTAERFMASAVGQPSRLP
jgi:hypothetical protein